MIPILLFVSVLQSCMPLISSATYENISMPNFPKSFSCPAFGPFKYPFYDATASDTQCGLIKVNCTLSHENIEFGGASYEIAGKLGPDHSIVVRNTTFQKLIENQSCEALESNFGSPTPLLFSISLAPNMTLYKCTKDPKYVAEMDAYFIQPDYSSYDCRKDHKFYYRLPIGNTTVPSDLPHTCEVIQLPSKLQPAGGEQHNDTNIFSLLSSVSSISFHLSPSCDGCNIKGGECDTLNEQFQCLYAKKVNHGRNLRLILALSVGANATLILIVLCFRMTLTWRTKAKNDVNEEIFLKNHEFLAPKRYSYSQVKKMTNSFKVKLGQGGFGFVYKGALSNGNLVAVKVLSELKGKGEDFINEVASVGRTSHVNIVSLVGFCLEGRQRALIYEFMPNGSLEKFIYNQASSRNSQLGWEKLHQIAIGIARGFKTHP